MEYELTAKRLQQAIDRSGMIPTELARCAGVSDASVSQYLNGKNRPTKKTADKIGKTLNVNPLWLMGYDVSMSERGDPFERIANLSTPAAHPLPIIGEICAGNGIDCEENFQGLFFVDSSIKADYCLRVSGDSMIEASIYDGDLAFIQKTETFQKGSIYAVLICGENTASLKRVYDKGEELLLMPCNAQYEPMLYRKDDVLIIGECIGSFHEQKKDTTSAKVMSP